ncbi:HAMP domain-containing histidine kinase [Streptomyces actuosus]|uniref:histidine kinase n=1 Tax=Streptomyces actuosus TaxID=1885 RepID=A0ABS2W0H6_STRAS|nr:HAMP domain-containing sensor histidine kinase [Streptomyces actuosus]MBN0048901.1 HAMP domain-containing histidine kinase [Streptomyces actuosus]
MRLRARLALLVAVLLTGAVAVLGGGTLWWTRSNLVAEADARLVHARAQPPSAQPGQSAQSGVRPGGDQSPARQVALLRFDSRGLLEQVVPSELTGDLDPLPDVSWKTALSGGPDGRIRSAGSVDGTLEYHWAAVRRPDGGVTVFAVSLMEAARTTDLLLGSLLLGGGAVVALGGGVGRWVVRRQLRPLDDLVDATEAVAAGDLTRRTRPRATRDEVGRLTTRFDHMLVQLDASLAAREAARLRLEQFVADASHELRTPLALIRGYAELHGRGGLPPGPLLERAMSRIATETERMTGLVEDLLLLARLDHEAADADADADVEVAGVLGDAVEEHRAIGTGHRVELDLATGPAVSVRANALRLRQVIGNLLANVRNHTPPGTLTRITAEAVGPVVEIRVIDNGPGIAAADRPYVFERFFRPDGSRARRRSGTGSGLGLAIVAALVSSCDGTVTALETPGGGATFLVRLPRPPASGEPAAREVSANLQEGLSGSRP